MAPVATSENSNGMSNGRAAHGPIKVFNPFYSPPAPEDSEKDKSYQYAQYKASIYYSCCAHCADGSWFPATLP